MKKKVWLAGMAAGLLTMGLFLSFPGAVDAATLPAGITIGGFELGGMTKEEAQQKLTEHMDQISSQQLTITVDGNEVTTTAAELGLYWSNKEEAQEAADRYSGGNLLERYLDLKNLEKQPVNMELTTALDEEKVKAFVEEKCTPFIVSGKDAEITREGDQFIVTESVKGLIVDTQATKAALDEALKAGLDSPITVSAVVTEAEPLRSTEALSTISDVLGTFSTGFSAGNVSRSTNLRNGASKVNGWVLMPGEEFSAYVAMTPFTAANGYASAASYANGKVVDTVGGGACQLCTTLYNAALRAEVEITQRQNHSMVVGYVSPSEDAAIAGTIKDLKFKNNYTTPIYIEGAVNGGTLTFTIYGQETRPANRTIKFVSETLGSIDPGQPTLKVDPSLAPGAKVREQSAHVGKRSRLWKYVYVDGVETEKEILHTDSYMASKAIYRVGPDAPVAPPPTEPVLPVTPELPPPVVVEPTQPTQPAGPASEGPGAEPPAPPVVDPGPAAEGPAAEGPAAAPGA